MTDPPAHWPEPSEIAALLDANALVMLPELLGEDDGHTVAHFRVEAQEIRVRATEAGIRAVLATPANARLAGYSEFAADWILPALAAAALSVPAGLAADMIHDRLSNRDEHAAAPTVRYREAVIDDGKLRLREIEGPAREVEQLLRERAQEAPRPARLLPRPPHIEER